MMRRCSRPSSMRLPLLLLLLTSMSRCAIICATAESDAKRRGVDSTNCRSALGMQSGEIPDSAITASSSFDQTMFGPSNARIRTEGDGGAWCPKDQVLKNGDEYLEIDLGMLKVITLVETQGRFGNGQGQEYVEQYRLQYQREDSGRWFTFHNRRGQQIFQGNANTYMSELREVDPPLITRRIRFVPYSVHPKHACLRVELYGCTWKDGIISYDIPQGDRRGVDTDFTDVIYDGLVDGYRLTGGLGQLTDGDFGSPNFRLVDTRGTGIKGYDWVGWNNDSASAIIAQSTSGSSGSPTVEMIFRFDAVRNFSAVRLHCNNMFTRDVRVFRSALPAVSRDGATFTQVEQYITPALQVETPGGGRSSLTSSESVRNVTVPMHGAIGRFVRLRLEFNARWMLISEVEFTSEYAPDTQYVETAHPGRLLQDSNNASVRSLTQFDVTVDSSNARNSDTSSNDLRSAASDDDVIESVNYNRKRLKDEYLGILIGSLATLAVLLFVVAAILVWRRRRRLNGVHRRVLKCFDTVPSVVAGSVPQQTRHCAGPNVTAPTGKIVNGARYEFVGTADLECSPDFQLNQTLGCCAGGSSSASKRFHNGCIPASLPELPATPPDSTSDTFTPNDYSSVRVNKRIEPYADVGLLSSDESRAVAESVWVSQRPAHRDATRQFATLQGVRGHRKTSGTTAVTSSRERSLHGGNSLVTLLDNAAASSSKSAEQLLDLPTQLVPPDIVQYLEKLDEGRFGEMYLCEVSDTYNDLSASQQTRLAVVKMLRPSADEKTKQGFQRMIWLASRATDCDNVARCLGLCHRRGEIGVEWVMFQYTKYGDLKAFLRQHHLAANDVSGVRSGHPPLGGATLSHGTLVYLASQISSAMKHLELLNVVHGNLAARTCLVDDLYQIKVSDIGDTGAGRVRYPDDYSSADFTPAPAMALRWMAWESVFKGEYTSKSDVWSFGVTLWEILTLAFDRRPFDDSLPTDSDVLANLDACWRGASGVCQPAMPIGCPREIYDLMRECWQRDPATRPSFREVHMFLQRKNVGYQPSRPEAA